jgi:iron complex outermembrane receptor protein
VGGFLSDTLQHVYNGTYVYAAEASAVPLLARARFPALLRSLNYVSAWEYVQDGRAYSAFTQLSYKPINTVEITAGGRYSYEKKDLPLAKNGNGGNLLHPLGPNTFFQPLISDKTWTDFSPEATIAYHPTQTLNFFGSYKHGFLSGGYQGATPPPNRDLTYAPETIKGFEVGAKASLLDGTLRTNVAAYTYKVADLQVTNNVNGIQLIRNAAEVKLQGFEGDANYLAALQGLSLHAAVAYNHGVYTSFRNAPCYTGQSPAEGCAFNPVSRAFVQDLSGQGVIQSPAWAGSTGFDYETPVGNGLKIGLSSDVNYNSSQYTEIARDPLSKMHAYGLVDASLRLAQAQDKWEVALVGRNLGDERFWLVGNDSSFTGFGTGTAAEVQAQKRGVVSRGREIMVRVSAKFE